MPDEAVEPATSEAIGSNWGAASIAPRPSDQRVATTRRRLRRRAATTMHAIAVGSTICWLPESTCNANASASGTFANDRRGRA